MILSIVVVNWNTRDCLLRCLASLRHASWEGEKEIVVVDNASADDSVAAVRSAFPEVRVVANQTNRGFAGGVNDGIAVSTGECVLILNPDIMVGKETLVSLAAAIQTLPYAGAVTPRLVNDDGSMQCEYLRKLPSVPQVMLFSTMLAQWARHRPGLVSRYLLSVLPEDGDPHEIEQIPGAFVFTTRAVITQTRGFDESFKLFYEDVDWSFRVRGLGLRLYLVPMVVATHSGGKSFTPRNAVWLHARFQRSLLHFFQLHASGWASAAVRVILVENALLSAAYHLLVRPFTRGARRAAETIAVNKHLRTLSAMLTPDTAALESWPKLSSRPPEG